MNVASVRLFLEVAEAGSLSKVATRRQTVQSHISRQVTEFEASIGAALFRRTGRGVVLTELGVRAQMRLRAWLQETDRLALELQGDAGRLLGVVRIGIVPSAAHPLLTHVHERLQAEHPGISLNVIEAQGTELDALLDNGLVDLAIVFRFNRPSGSHERLLSVAHSFVISRPGDAVTRRETVSFSRLDGLKLVLPRAPSQWRTALDETARSFGFKLQAVVEADSLALQKELVAHTPGLYSVLGPYTIAPDLATGRLAASRLVKPELVRHVTLALPKQGKLSPACREVAGVIERLTRDWGGQLTLPAADAAR